MKLFIMVLAACSWIALHVPVHARVMANPAASSAVGRYDHTGLIQEIDIAGRGLVINDKRYFFASATTPVHDAAGRRYVAGLKKNMRIGYNVSTAGSKASIAEVWVLEEPKP